MVWVCEGGRSAYLRAVDKGGSTTMFLRNCQFMDYDRRHQLDQEATKAAVEGAVAGGRCLPWRQLSSMTVKYAAAAVRRASGAVAGNYQGNACQAETGVCFPSKDARR